MKQAAEHGHVEAQFVLGQYYKTGAGVKEDIPMAVRWLMTAALNGHQGAQVLLGNMYRTGDGVPQNNDEADRWYDMADSNR
jgi:hypothetical protein